MVYWKDCRVKVYRAGSTRTPIVELETCDGEGLVKKDTWLLFAGTNGRVKEV